VVGHGHLHCCALAPHDGVRGDNHHLGEGECHTGSVGAQDFGFCTVSGSVPLHDGGCEAHVLLERVVEGVVIEGCLLLELVVVSLVESEVDDGFVQGGQDFASLGDLVRFQDEHCIHWSWSGLGHDVDGYGHWSTDQHLLGLDMHCHV